MHKNKPYKLLKTGMVGGPSTVFCQYHETGKSRIRGHNYQDTKTCTSVIGFNVSLLYFCCFGQEVPCSKEECIETSSRKSCEELCNQVRKGELYRLWQVDIHIPDELTDKFSEFCPLFVADAVPKELIPRDVKEYQERTGQKMIHGIKKLLGVMCVEEILLYSPLLKWYLRHGLKVSAIHTYLTCNPGKPFEWFCEEVMYQSILSLTTLPPGDPWGFAHSQCPGVGVSLNVFAGVLNWRNFLHF